MNEPLRDGYIIRTCASWYVTVLQNVDWSSFDLSVCCDQGKLLVEDGIATQVFLELVDVKDIM
jgi:hypothetical protein